MVFLCHFWKSEFLKNFTCYFVSSHVLAVCYATQNSIIRLHIVYSSIQTTIAAVYILNLDAGNMCFFLTVKGCYKWYQQNPLLLNPEVFIWPFMWRVLWKWFKPSQLSFICQRGWSLLTPAVQSFSGRCHWGWRMSRPGVEPGECVYVCVLFSLQSNSKAK